MTNREQLLTTWTALKEKLSSLTFLIKHKWLLKEAVKFHIEQMTNHSYFSNAYRSKREVAIKECREVLKKLT